MGTDQLKTSCELIYSSYASDPEFRDLLEDFVARVPDRVSSMRGMMSDQDAGALIIAVHQLRGACGSYGFNELTSQAQELENSLTAHVALVELNDALEAFLSACSRMTASVAEFERLESNNG